MVTKRRASRRCCIAIGVTILASMVLGTSSITDPTNGQTLYNCAYGVDGATNFSSSGKLKVVNTLTYDDPEWQQYNSELLYFTSGECTGDECIGAGIVSINDAQNAWDLTGDSIDPIGADGDWKVQLYEGSGSPPSWTLVDTHSGRTAVP